MKVKRPQEKGAALITALLTVTLAAVLVSGLLWRQEVQLRRVQNQRDLAQARWVSRGAFDWTRLILRAEADAGPVTYLGGVWSVPIAPTRLSDFLGQLGAKNAERGAETWMTGSIVDGQGMLNLRNLVTTQNAADLTIDPVTLAQLKKLLSLLGMNSELSQRVADRMRLSVMQSAGKRQSAATSNAASDALAATQAAGTQSGGDVSNDPGLSSGDDSAVRPIMMTSLSSLLDIPGFTPEMVDRLAPFVTILPTPTPLNLNTAAPEVIAASLSGLALSGAQAFVHSRDQAFLINLGDAQTRLSRLMPTTTSGSSVDLTHFDVTTRYFWIRGRVQQGRAVVDRSALIYRDARTHSTTIVRVIDTQNGGA